MYQISLSKAAAIGVLMLLMLNSLDSFGKCGKARASVKNASDHMSMTEDFSTNSGEISDLVQVAPQTPTSKDGRVEGMETTIFTVTGILMEYKLEPDGDVHMVLEDEGNTLVAEIPSPECVNSGSPYHRAIVTARRAFVSTFHLTRHFKKSNAKILVVGFGFFDRLHGAKGAAPNGIELHPVIGFVVLRRPTVDTNADHDEDDDDSSDEDTSKMIPPNSWDTTASRRQAEYILRRRFVL